MGDELPCRGQEAPQRALGCNVAQPCAGCQTEVLTEVLMVLNVQDVLEVLVPTVLKVLTVRVPQVRYR